MEKVKTLDTLIVKQSARNQLVTLEDLEIFKQDLLSCIRTLFTHHALPQPKKWLKSYEVKKLLGISSGTLQTLRNNGTIPFSKIGGTIYYDAHEVNKVIERQRRF